MFIWRFSLITRSSQISLFNQITLLTTFIRSIAFNCPDDFGVHVYSRHQEVQPRTQECERPWIRSAAQGTETIKHELFIQWKNLFM